jgi:F0F1-type ATP synthase gamma subunit
MQIFPYRLSRPKDHLAPQGQKILLESSPHEMINYLTERRLIQLFDSIFEESKLSEFSARAIHLEEMYQNLTKQGKHLRAQYFRAQHEMIDKGTREIFASQILGKKKRSVEVEAVE